MKTELLDTFQAAEEGFSVYNTLVLENDRVLLKGKHKLGEKPILLVEIKGTIDRLIDVSGLRGLNTSIQDQTIFTYKNGFGLIDHDHANLYLWENLHGEPMVVDIQQRPSNDQLELFDKYLEYASYDDTTDTFVIGIGAKHSPIGYAKWFAELDLGSIDNPTTVKAFWDAPYQLKREDYPKTYLHYMSPTLEWLNINDLSLIKNKKHIVCKGGQHTKGRSGVEFEFYILAVYDNQNRLIKKLEMEFGYGRFSTDKKYYILRPKKKKRLFVYNLETLELEYNIPLKSENNMGTIPTNYVVRADLKNDLLYVRHFNTINVCKLVR
jgi:hypothetical protein